MVELEPEREHANDEQLGLNDAIAKRRVHLAYVEWIHVGMESAVAYVQYVS